MQLVTRVLGEIGGDISDLSVTPVDDIHVASRVSEPRLKVIA